MFDERLKKLPMEIKGLILENMAAQDLDQLRNVRLTNKFVNTAILSNETGIVWSAVNSKSSVYRTAHILNHDVCPPINPGFEYLSSMARRCDMAKQLAILAAAEVETTGPSCGGTLLDETSRTRFIKNLGPYVLALDHFFECFHGRLVEKINDLPNPTGLSSVSVKYNRETVSRICALYGILDRAFHRKIEGPDYIASTLFEYRPPDDSDCFLAFLTFGGLAALRETMKGTYTWKTGTFMSDILHRNHGPRRSDRRVFNQLVYGLPEHVLYCGFVVKSHGSPDQACSRKEEFERFYQYLLTHEGSAPDLLQ